MSKKFFRRAASLAAAAVISAGAIAMFAGCTSSNPEVTVTYSFNGKTYEVEYTLSRSDAPQTVQHFIDLADAGYYDNTCIHNYTANAMYGGGYTFNDSKELVEKNYFAEVTALEAAGNSFTQSVYYTRDGARTPLYTVYGEFADNGVENESGREYVHSKGALVMYYTDKTSTARSIQVTVERNDGGKNNEGETEQDISYATNSATSLFYTYLGTSATDLDSKYAVFGKAKDYDGQMQPLLDAIEAYKGTLTDDETTADVDESSFTEVRSDYKLDTLDHPADVSVFANIAQYFESVRKGGVTETFNVPRDMPIIIQSVEVTKY